MVLTVRKISRDWQIVALLTIATLFAGLFPLWGQTTVNQDALWYISCARCLEMGDFDAATNFYMVPFVPWAIVFFHQFCSDWVLAARMLSLASMTLLTIPFYWLVRNLFDRKSAILSTAVLVVSPYLREITAQVLREPPFLLFLCTFFTSLYCAIATRKWYWYSIAVCSATLAACARIEGLGLFALLVAYLVVESLRQRRWKIVCAIAFVTVVSPLLAYGYIPKFAKSIRNRTTQIGQMEVFTLRENLKTYEQEWNAQLRSPRRRNSSHRSGFVESSRRYIFVLYLISWLHHFFRTVFPLIFPVAAIGMIVEYRSAGAKNIWLIRVGLFFFLLLPLYNLLAFDFLSMRYFLAPALLMHIWVGKGCTTVADWIATKIPSKYILLGFLLVLLVPLGGRLLRFDYGEKDNIKQAGIWLRQNFPQAQGLVTNEQLVFLYADSTLLDAKRFRKSVSRRVRFATREYGQSWYIHSKEAQIVLDKAREIRAEIIVYQYEEEPQWQLESGEIEQLQVFPGKSKIGIFRVDWK